MSRTTRSEVNKLLRVLVAGGVSLAGVAGMARADDKPAEPAQASEKAKEGKSKEADKQADKKSDKAEKKATKETKPAEPEGGGVKGW